MCFLFQGDGNIRYYEIVDQSPYVYYLSEYLSSSPQRGLGELYTNLINLHWLEREIVDQSPYVYYLSEYLSSSPQRGLGELYTLT